MQKGVSAKERWKRLRQRLPRIKPWAALATLLGTAVFLYWTYLGVSYAATTRQAASLEQEAAGLTAGLVPATSQSSPGSVEVAEGRFQELAMVFKRNDSETIAQRVYEVADATGAEVTSLVMAKASAKVEDGVLYQIQPLSLNLNGSNDKVVRFLDELHLQIPALVVADARLSGAGAGSVAQVQLVLYISPQAAPKESATKKK